MLGVVIWTDVKESKAIIWCEDHGELAFLANQSKIELGAETFDQGDLIQFDLEEHRNLRLAQNPRKIEQHYCDDVKAMMHSGMPAQAETLPNMPRKKPEAISLAKARRARLEASVGSAA